MCLSADFFETPAHYVYDQYGGLVEVPEGYEVLEEGYEKRVRIEKAYIREGEPHKPFFVLTGDDFQKLDTYSDVKFVDPPEFGFQENARLGCLVEPRTVFLRTNGPLIVKP